jgi:hypothetical protein
LSDLVVAVDRTGSAAVGREAAEDWAAYREYRRRQAAELLSFVPREAVRPLYRRAKDEAGGSESGDSLGLLTMFCERLLPLPPFDVWLIDRQAHPAAYLDEEERGPRPGQAHDHVTVEVRVLERDGDLWDAELDVRSEGDVCRGHITFRSAGRPEAHSTGEIFREATAEAVRDRFLEFDDQTLRAFLRSVLP